MKFLILSFLLILSSCSTSEKWKTSQKDLTIMTYNVENLFDTKHDKGKEDYAYLPKSVKDANPKYLAHCASIKVPAWRGQCFNTNWTKEALKRKMERLADVIMKVKNGQGPDILILEEVENLHVLEMLRKGYLKSGKYKKSILLEGPDKRGIDTAIITRLPLSSSPKIHTLKFKAIGELRGRKKRPTRGILEATLALPNKSLLTIFAIHFPSQGGPTELRRQALAKLRKLKIGLPKDRMVIVGGDFNITDTEDLKYDLLDTYIKPHFDISHKVGLFNEKGTEVYRGHWSFLDMLLFSKNMTLERGDASWYYKPESLRIMKSSIYQVSRFYTPNRFNANSAGGVSDHYPVVVDISLRATNKN